MLNGESCSQISISTGSCINCMSDICIEEMEKINSSCNTTKYSATKKGVGDKENRILSYAYDISNDKDFVRMLLAENGTIDTRRQSNYVKDGVREPSYGICQIHCNYHSDKCRGYTKPTWEGFYDPKWQVETCYEMYKEGTVFYGLNRYKKDKEFQGRIDNLLTFNK